MSTFFVLALLVVAVPFAVRSIIKSRKKGHCSCGCSGCAKANSCTTSSTKPLS